MNFSGTKNLTKGSLLGTLIVFAVPFLLANLMQTLYGAVDLWVIGKFGGGKIGISAIANGGEVMHMVMSFIMGLTTAGTVIVGRFFGADDKRNAERATGMTLSFSLISGIVFNIILLFCARTVVRWLNTPAEAVDATLSYVYICSWGVLFISEYNCLSGIFRGYGNSFAPLCFVSIACLTNVIGDLLLVAVFKMGVAGAAIATVCAQGLSCILSLGFLKIGGFGFKFCWENFKIKLDLLKEYIKTGVPIALQNTLTGFSFVFIISVVNKIGGESSAAAAGYGIVNRFNGIAMLPAFSFAMALNALTAQNIGAGKSVRAIRTLWLAIGITMLCGSMFLAFCQFFPEKVVLLFIDVNGNGAAEVIKNGAAYARSMSWEYILVPIVFCTNGFFVGCGRSFFSMANNLLSTFMVRIPIAYFVGTISGATLFHIGLAAPLASTTSNIIALIYLFSGKWRKPKSYLGVKNQVAEK